MKILMSADCFYPAQMGGPSNAIYWQAKALTRAGHDVTVVATSQDLAPEIQLDTWLTMDCGQVIYTRNPHFHLPIIHIWHGWQAIRKTDIVHINSLFYPASMVWALMSWLANKPVVWSPHGELSPVALRIRPRLKRLLLTVFKRLSSPIWFHATCADETTYIRQQFGQHMRVIELRNMMELPLVAAPTSSARPYLLFIGRLHPIKAIDRLLEALSASKLFRESASSLLIAGPDSDKAYTQQLRQQVQELDLEANVSFTGVAHGDAKEQLYANALVTILPSHTENFGNVVIESLAQGTPVIASTGTPWQLLEKEQAGSWTPNEPDLLRQAIETYLTMPATTYRAYRKRAIDLARRDYDVMANVAVWERVYESVLAERTLRPNKAIDFHNDIATQFDQKYESSAAFQERFRVWTDLFRQYVKPADQVMDLGCGSGIFSYYLAQKGCRVIGIDGSVAMIDLCRQKNTSANVHYVRQALPFTDPITYAQQDIVIMSSLLEYLDDMEQMLQQVHHLLKPNGLFIVSIPNSLSIYRRLERIFFRLTGYPAYFAYARNQSTEAAFGRHLTRAGFDVLEAVYFSSQDPVSRVIKPLFAKQYVNNLFVVVCRKKRSKQS